MDYRDEFTNHKFSFKTLKFMMKNAFRASPILFPILVVIVMINIGIGIVLIYLVKDSTNGVIELIEGRGDLTLVFLLIGAYLFLQLFVRLFLDWLREFTEHHFFRQSENYFHRMVLYKLGKIPQESMYDKRTYEQFRFTYQNMYMFYDIPWMLLRFIIDFGFEKMLYLGVIFSFNLYIGLYCLLLFIINIGLGAMINRRIGKIHRKNVKPRRIKNYYKDQLTDKRYVKETKLFKLEMTFFNRLKDKYFEIVNSYFKVYRLNEIVAQIIHFINYVFRIGLTVLLLYMVYQKEINVGEALLIQMAALMILNSSWQFKRPIGNIVRFVSYAPTMIDLLYPLSKKDVKEIDNYKYQPFELTLGDFEKLELNNVSYSYPSREDNQVENVSLKIHKGEIISILGYNGSGKTTTAKLISGVLPASKGKVTINDKEIKGLDVIEVHKYFGIGFQDYGKYGLSLKDNIILGKVEDQSNDDMLFDAVKKANLASLLAKLPDGIDTYLGKEFKKTGQDVSGGEWQRIILSRAYMGTPEILILDEPTASIDPFEEERMLEQFKEILSGKTALLISHRISFARLADRIIMMKDGKIVEQGSHSELMKIKGYYHELFSSQKELYVGGEDNE